MHLSIHYYYYVLLLTNNSSKLFEGFRDELIVIENGDFPAISTPDQNTEVKNDALQENDLLQRFYRNVDQSFTKYYSQDPLKLVLMSEKTNQSVFRTVTTHNNDIIGVVEGDFSATSMYDLGQIAWPIVRKALSGDRERALCKLDEAVNSGNIAIGLDEVWYMANSILGCSTLFVAEDYQVKGNVVKMDKTLMILEDVDIMQVFDDVVDALIEKVLELGGHVIFMNSCSLTKFHRIALIH